MGFHMTKCKSVTGDCIVIKTTQNSAMGGQWVGLVGVHGVVDVVGVRGRVFWRSWVLGVGS